MATLKSGSFTPEYIQNRLFYFNDVAQKFHHDTKMFSEHMALDKLYTGLVSFKDDICELIIGYQDGKRIGRLKIDDIPEYSHSESVKMVKELKDFSYELYEWAGEKKYCDIENTAQSLSGLAAKTLYLLTLS